MTTAWFNRRPGDFASPSTEDETMLLVGNGDPDWVRLPSELGGARVRVSGSFRGPCPVCTSKHPVKHLVLEGTPFRVAECVERGFLWYRLKENSDEQG